MNEELSNFLKSAGASLVAFADLCEVENNSCDGFPSGISIAVALNPQIMSEITEGPTRHFFDEYKRLNILLDNLGQAAEQFLLGKGYMAKARPATFNEDATTLSAKLPHKTVATCAGLGWIGKCALLVTKEYGSARRLTTVLTDAPLSAGKPVHTSHCGKCTDCVDLCPAGGLTGMNWHVGVNRDLLFNAFTCRDTARNLSLKGFGIRITLCGRCIVVCPWTKKYLEKTV